MCIVFLYDKLESLARRIRFHIRMVVPKVRVDMMNMSLKLNCGRFLVLVVLPHRYLRGSSSSYTKDLKCLKVYLWIVVFFRLSFVSLELKTDLNKFHLYCLQRSSLKVVSNHSSSLRLLYLLLIWRFVWVLKWMNSTNILYNFPHFCGHEKLLKLILK